MCMCVYMYACMCLQCAYHTLRLCILWLSHTWLAIVWPIWLSQMKLSVASQNSRWFCTRSEVAHFAAPLVRLIKITTQNWWEIPEVLVRCVICIEQWNNKSDKIPIMLWKAGIWCQGVAAAAVTVYLRVWYWTCCFCPTCCKSWHSNR